MIRVWSRHEKAHRHCLPLHTTGSARFLRPGRSEIVRVAAPSHQTAWREVFYFSDATLGRRVNIVLQRTPLRHLAKDLPIEHIKSDWIDK